MDTKEIERHRREKEFKRIANARYYQEHREKLKKRAKERSKKNYLSKKNET